MGQEQPSPAEIRPQFAQTVKFAEDIIAGRFSDKLPSSGVDPAEVFMGPLVDLNDESLTESERIFMLGWIEGKLGTTTSKAGVKAEYRSPDGETMVTVYNVPLGQTATSWYISQWQNTGEKPSYVFWSGEMYEEQVEQFGYTKEPV